MSKNDTFKSLQILLRLLNIKFFQNPAHLFSNASQRLDAQMNSVMQYSL